MAETTEKTSAEGRDPTAERDARPEGEASAPRGRARTCVGCGERVAIDAAGPSSPLVRLILGPGGVVAVDPGDGGFGRGAHVHPRPDCLTRAAQRGLSRAARGRVHAIHGDPAEGAAEGTTPLTPASLAQAIRRAMDRRVQGLVQAAVRSRAAAIGADAASEALQRGAALALCACDAAAGAELPEVRAAVAAGRAAAWGTKQQLGALAGGRREQGVAVMAITSGSLAAAIAEAVQIADACAAVERGAPAAGPRGGRAGGGSGPKPASPAEPVLTGAGAGGAPKGASRRGEERKSLQGRAQRRMDVDQDAAADPGRGETRPPKDGARGGTTGKGAAARRNPRGWARRTGNVERGA